MVDREKVIKGIEHHMKGECGGCPYCKGWHACEAVSEKGLFTDALAMLKEQEPVKPVPDTSYGARPWWFVCGNCKLSVNEDQKYCPNCGRKVKWE